MNPLDTLREKPWLPDSAADQVGTLAGPPPGRIALRFFIAVVSVLFFLFIITFLSRSQYPDFEALAGAPRKPR